MKYAELATDEEADAVCEELGRKHAEANGLPWPMPPEIVGPGRFPCGLTAATPFSELTSEQQALVPRIRHFGSVLRHDDGVPGVRARSAGGVLEVDAAVDAMKIDRPIAKVEKEQLTEKARSLVERVRPEPVKPTDGGPAKVLPRKGKS